MISLGLLFFVPTIICLFAWVNQRQKLQQLRQTPFWTVQQLADFARATRQDFGTLWPAERSFKQMVALTGMIHAESPLTSELAQQPCVYYEMSVVRRWRRNSKVIAQQTCSVPFWLEDATGRVLVDPKGGRIETVRVVDTFEPAVGAAADLGGTTVHWAGPVNASQSLGDQFREEILPLDRRVYVLGEATDVSGQLTIRRPQRQQDSLIISLRSQEQLARSTRTAVRVLPGIGSAFGIASIALVLLDLLG